MLINPNSSTHSAPLSSPLSHLVTDDQIESSTEAPILGKKITLRIAELMAENQIRHVSTLHRILISKQIKISHSQLLRIVDNRFDHVNMEYLEAFLDIFKCSINDLFKVS